MKEKHGEREKRWLFYLNGRAGIYMYLQQKSPHQALQMECLPFVFEKKHGKKKLPNLIAISLQWTTECFKSDCGQNLWKIIFVLQHFVDQKHGEKKLPNLIAIVWTWPTECFWSDCGQNLWIAIFILQHVFDKHRIKTLIHFTAIVWTRPTECFKSDCEHNSYIQNYSNIV